MLSKRSLKRKDSYSLFMKWLIIKYMWREYKVGDTNSGFASIVASLVLHRNEFILEGGGFIASFQKIRDDIEFEVGME